METFDEMDTRIAAEMRAEEVEEGIVTEDDTALVRRRDFILALRQFADFLEAHPAVPFQEQSFLAYVYTREELAACAAIGAWEKHYDSNDYFTLRKRFAGGINLDVYTNREKVCRRVVKGQRVIPPMPATEETTEDIVVWVCDEPLLAAK